jgi:hypothetical protein
VVLHDSLPDWVGGLVTHLVEADMNKVVRCALCPLYKVVDEFGDLHHIAESGDILDVCPARTGALHFNEKTVRQ